MITRVQRKLLLQIFVIVAGAFILLLTLVIALGQPYDPFVCVPDDERVYVNRALKIIHESGNERAIRWLDAEHYEFAHYEFAWNIRCNKVVIGKEVKDLFVHDVLLVDLSAKRVDVEWFLDCPTYVSWSPDDKFLHLITDKYGDPGCACTGGMGTVAIMDTKTRKVRRFHSISPCTPGFWSPNSRYIALDDSSEDGYGPKGVLQPGVFKPSKKAKTGRPTGKFIKFKIPKRRTKEGQLYRILGWTKDGLYVVLVPFLEEKTMLLVNPTTGKIAKTKPLPMDEKARDKIYEKLLWRHPATAWSIPG